MELNQTTIIRFAITRGGLTYSAVCAMHTVAAVSGGVAALPETAKSIVLNHHGQRRLYLWCRVCIAHSDNSEVGKKKMGLPHITTFCWCMGLEVGSRVIGYIHLLVSTAMVTLCSLSAASAGAHMGLEEDGEERIYSRWFTVTLVVAVASLVHILLAATLIYAVHKRNTCALVVWVRVMCVLFAAALIYVLVSMIAYKAHGSGSEIFLAFLEGALFFGILTYCILCVNSYYLVLKSTEDMVGPNKVEY